MNAPFSVFRNHSPVLSRSKFTPARKFIVSSEVVTEIMPSIQNFLLEKEMFELDNVSVSYSSKAGHLGVPSLLIAR